MKNISNKSGFTLIEVLVATVILSTALFGLGALTSTVVRNNSFSRQMTVATVLAQDKLEELANLPVTDADLNDNVAGNNSDAELVQDNFTDSSDANNPIDESGSAGGIYTRTWNVWDVNGDDSRLDIAVIVTWQDAYGVARTMFISTVKTY